MDRSLLTLMVRNTYLIPLKWLSILIVKLLQYRYKKLNVKRSSSYASPNIILLQALLYYFKTQFSCWGYFHYDCTWTEKDEIFFNKLFPVKDFKERDIAVWYNPEAVTYYMNKIYTLSKGKPPNYERDIKKQLAKWGKWN